MKIIHTKELLLSITRQQERLNAAEQRALTTRTNHRAEKHNGLPSGDCEDDISIERFLCRIRTQRVRLEALATNYRERIIPYAVLDLGFWMDFVVANDAIDLTALLDVPPPTPTPATLIKDN
jgi:hypothetical protein